MYIYHPLPVSQTSLPHCASMAKDAQTDSDKALPAHHLENIVAMHALTFVEYNLNFYHAKILQNHQKAGECFFFFFFSKHSFLCWNLD